MKMFLKNGSPCTFINFQNLEVRDIFLYTQRTRQFYSFSLFIYLFNFLIFFIYGFIF
jgi:hypothetical protein